MNLVPNPTQDSVVQEFYFDELTENLSIISLSELRISANVERLGESGAPTRTTSVGGLESKALPR